MKLGRRIIGIAGALTLLLSGPALAQQTLDFEDLPCGCNTTGLPLSYMGFEWSSTWGSCKAASLPTLNTTGISNGISSGDVGIFNQGGSMVWLTRATPFAFLSAFLNPAWKEGLNITIIGSLGGVEVFTTLLTLDASTLGSLVNFGYWVDELRFSTTGGTVAMEGGVPYKSNCEADTACTEFIMDDFTYSNVPEPMSFALTGTGLLGLALFHRRRKRHLKG